MNNTCILKPAYIRTYDLFQQIIEMYRKDLPNKDVVNIDLSSWKRKWIECNEKLRPKIIESLLKKCSKDMFPNLSVLLKLDATLPVTSWEFERSFSILQYLRTLLRASMITKRILSLAIINIHREVQNDYKRVYF